MPPDATACRSLSSPSSRWWCSVSSSPCAAAPARRGNRSLCNPGATPERRYPTFHHSHKLRPHLAAHTGFHTMREVIMCCATCGDVSFGDLLQDPLIQLVMRSDGVTEWDMI